MKPPASCTSPRGLVVRLQAGISFLPISRRVSSVARKKTRHPIHRGPFNSTTRITVRTSRNDLQSLLTLTRTILQVLPPSRPRQSHPLVRREGRDCGRGHSQRIGSHRVYSFLARILGGFFSIPTGKTGSRYRYQSLKRRIPCQAVRRFRRKAFETN